MIINTKNYSMFGSLSLCDEEDMEENPYFICILRESMIRYRIISYYMTVSLAIHNGRERGRGIMEKHLKWRFMKIFRG